MHLLFLFYGSIYNISTIDFTKIIIYVAKSINKRAENVKKIDFILLSPALFARMTNGGLFRKGAWPGVSPPRWETYPEVQRKVHVASDHHAIFADIDI